LHFGAASVVGSAGVVFYNGGFVDRHVFSLVLAARSAVCNMQTFSLHHANYRCRAVKLRFL
jgi:hypothetical protein